MKAATSIAVALATALSLPAAAQASDRSTYTAFTRGTSVNIPYSRVATLCGDWDGCEVRIGMFNWDGTRRTASRSSLFYLDTATRNWRAERSDRAGRTSSGNTQHVVNAWSCYFTDGRYINWANIGDLNTNFAVLSWNQYNARACKVTLID